MPSPKTHTASNASSNGSSSSVHHTRHTTDTSSPTPLPGRTPIQRRWNSVVRKVLEHKRKHNNPHDGEPDHDTADDAVWESAVGTRILDLLWEKESQRRGRLEAMDNRDNDALLLFRWTPLLSRHNARVLRRTVVQLQPGQWWRSARHGTHSTVHTERDSSRHCHSNHPNSRNHHHHCRPHWRGWGVEGLVMVRWTVLVWTITAAVVAWMAVTVVGCVWTTMAGMRRMVVHRLVPLLVDVHDVQRVWGWLVVDEEDASAKIQGWWSRWQTVVDTLLLRRRYGGREWVRVEGNNNNDDDTAVDFVEGPVGGLCAPQRSTTNMRNMTIVAAYESIEMRPPPSHRPVLASKATLAHVDAVKYCHTMLVREQHRKRERRRLRKMEAANSSSTTTTTTTILPTTTSERRLVVAGSTSTRTLEESSVTILTEASATRPEVELRQMASLDLLSEDDDDYDDDTERFSRHRASNGDDINNGRPLQESDQAAADMPWIDVGRKIGMQLLHSEHVQRAMTSQETKNRILETVNDLTDQQEARRRDAASPNVPSAAVVATAATKPVHPIWTSPGVAYDTEVDSGESPTAKEDENDDDDDSFGGVGQSHSFPQSPASPKSARDTDEGPYDRNSPSVWTRVQSRGGSDNLLENPGTPSAPSTPDHPTKSPHLRRTPYRTPSRKDVSEQLLQTSPVTDQCSNVVTPKKPINRRTRMMAEMTSNGSSRRSMTLQRREPLAPGIKVAVPLSPIQACARSAIPTSATHASTAAGAATRRGAHQMGTVVSSRRIYVESSDNDYHGSRGVRTCVSDSPILDSTNCLSVTVKLEKFFLRNGEFAELTFRVMDEWSSRYMPRHSKVPIGSCVATSFGLGVLVGWRVADDCHVVRSLWQCRGPGASNAYLNRHAIHSTIEAAVGFRVQTVFGWGIVLAYVEGGTAFKFGRFFVEIKEEGRHEGHVLELNRDEILSCHGAQFLPVIEHVREAALYQIRLDNYNAAVREQLLDQDAPTLEQELFRSWSECGEILWKSFLIAVEEDKDFNDGVNEFMMSIIEFLDRLDNSDGSIGSQHSTEGKESESSLRFRSFSDEIEVKLAPASEKNRNAASDDTQEPGFWIMNDLFGGVFETDKNTGTQTESCISDGLIDTDKASSNNTKIYDRIFAFLRTIMKTVSFARAASVDHPHFRLALAISYDFLLFIRTVVNIQQRNTSRQSLMVWKRAWEEIVSTFGPIKERLESIGRGIAQRMESQGRKAKIRVLKFADRILNDDRLLFALEQGEWDRCLARVEIALVEAEVIQEENLFYYRKAARFVFDHVNVTMEGNGDAATRNSEKLAFLALFVKAMASPRRSILKVFCHDNILELFERILVRAYYKEEVATRMLTIHAANFHSLRHFRMLKDFSVAGRIWIPLLDAADEEFSWLVSTLPENSKEIMCPLSSLFSLCAAQFHKINAGDLSRDWLAFLLDDESIQIIHDVDMMLILALESFSRDVREMMTVLPYYPSIDIDILNLMDEVNIDEFLKEMSEAMDDPEKISQYVREKATISIERFLNYLPKMSIPVEKRELGDGWLLTCQGEDGGGLTLSDVTIKRENLVCQVLGGDTLFFPMIADEGTEPMSVVRNIDTGNCREEEESILDHIRDLILNAQRHGCWTVGVGGVEKPPTDRYAASIFKGIPISNVLNCGIELWRNLELDDDELLEIAIRDITYHIQLHEERKANPPKAVEHVSNDDCRDTTEVPHASFSSGSQVDTKSVSTSSFDSQRHRFNPRVDPTVLFLEIKSLTLNLDNFFFRIEKGSKKTIFDPVFQGRGMLSLQNVSIRLRVECAKERVKRPGGVSEVASPILQLRDLDVTIDKLQMNVKDTSFGSDWILNKGVTVFEEKITDVVVGNLKEQIEEQVQNLIENLNSYFLVNPSLLLNLLGISLDDLDENVVWV